jgi:hypothetical protein
MSALHSIYLPLVATARKRLEDDPRLRALFEPNIEPSRLHWCLMQFSAWGIKMTEPVEGWIRRAGERCRALGFEELGRALLGHAKNEAGHEGLFLSDLHYLAEAWNVRGLPPVTAAQFLDRPSVPSMERYIAVHEEGIGGDQPFVQIAIEYEVERMTPILGPRLVDQCVRVLGPEVVKGLSFVQEHVSVDVGHTTFNERQIARFMEAHPHTAAPLGLAGATALGAYVDFLGDCLDAAHAETGLHRSSGAATTLLAEGAAVHAGAPSAL